MEPTYFPFVKQRSAHDDPQRGDQVSTPQGQVLRRVVSRDGSRVGYVTGAGLDAVQWCNLLAWQLWCDSTI